MLRIVSSNGEPTGPGEGGAKGTRTERRSAFTADANPAAAKLDCEIELGSIVVIALVEGMLRTGIARPEQAEAILTDVADRYDAIIAGAPDHIRKTAEWECFAARLNAAAAMIRRAVLDLVLG